MKPWQWVGLAGIGVAALAVMAYTTGLGVERNRGLTARLALITANAESARVHAAAVARLEVLAVSRETSRREAEARAEAADLRARLATGDAVAARGALLATRTAADSLLAYPPLVEALTRQVAATDSARVGYRDALTASQQRIAILVLRAGTDSAEIARQRKLILTVTPPPTPRNSWGCVAGITIAGGIRSGAGIGITCGRRLG